MNTTTFLTALESHPDHSVSFRLPGGDGVPGDYHITEISDARMTGVDCGGAVQTRRQTVVQLLAGRSGSAMTAGRAAAIFRRVLEGPAGGEFDPDADLAFEYDRAGEQLARYPLTDLHVESTDLVVTLGRLHSVCAPARSRAREAGACCS